MKTPTIEEFKAWAKEHQSLALAVCKAQAFAQIERERVSAYIRPIFDRYDFNSLPKIHNYQGSIACPDQLYLCADEVQCAAFYADCDKAHREHGWTGPEGHCPALTAEELQRIAEAALIKAGCELFGIESIVYGENRAKMLKLLLGACLIKAKKAA